MKTKALDLNLKDLDMGKREAVIAHATYKTFDRDGDISTRGMFDKSWRESFNLLRFYLNHDKKQAPGKPIQTWDDDNHAYTRVKFGTHSLGEDTLKQVDEGIIVAASFGFEPMRFKAIKGKGSQFTEVLHLETTVLTHWGAHDESGIHSVEKELGSEGIKQLHKSISTIEKFCRDTTASDDCIIQMQQEVKKLKQLLNKSSDTASTNPAIRQCPKCKSYCAKGHDESGRTICAECDHVIEGSPDASRNKDEVSKTTMLLRLKMQMSGD